MPDLSLTRIILDQYTVLFKRKSLLNILHTVVTVQPYEHDFILWI